MSQSRSPFAPSARIPALLVPVLLLAYGVLRFIDRVGGTDESGSLWVAGHVCFLGAIVGVAMLDVVLWRSLGQSIATDVADVLGLAGCAAFAWVILGDIFPDLDTAPDLVTALGPPVFLFGIFGLLGVAALRGRFTWPHWVLVVLGFGCVAVSLTLLPLAAVLLLLGFEPLRTDRRLLGAPRRSDTPREPSSSSGR